MVRHPIEDLEPVLSIEDVEAIQGTVREIHIEGDLLDYAVTIVHATRNHPALLLGCEPPREPGARQDRTGLGVDGGPGVRHT